jgi:hypothetical protein
VTSTDHILRLGIVFVLIAASALVQKETFVPANDVSFSISAEQQNYRTGERIRLRYRVANVGNAPLYVPREWEVKCPPNPHIWAWFENSSGQHFIPGYAGSCIPDINSQSISARMSKEAVLLKSGEHVDGTFELDTTLFVERGTSHSFTNFKANAERFVPDESDKKIGKRVGRPPSSQGIHCGERPGFDHSIPCA